MSTELTKASVLLVDITSVYGVERIYPHNDLAQALCDIAQTKTLDRRVLRIAADRLGYTVKTIQKELTL